MSPEDLELEPPPGELSPKPGATLPASPAADRDTPAGPKPGLTLTRLEGHGVRCVQYVLRDASLKVVLLGFAKSRKAAEGTVQAQLRVLGRLAR